MNHARQKHFKFVRICTDSLSSLQAFENYNIHNHQASIIRTYLCQMKKENIKIELEWVRGHDGLKIERVCRQSYKLYACTLKTVVLVLSALLTIFNLSQYLSQALYLYCFCHTKLLTTSSITT